jgi:predicted AAA+ superfamily ATPase
MITDRILLSEINNLKKSVLLLGPRQTGKSTLMRELKPDIEINFADQEEFLRFTRDPSLIKEIAKQYKKIFIDEVQRIPTILNTVQSILDRKSNHQFLLTGSSARKLRRGQANLLPGRVLSYELGPLTHQELGENFDVKKALSIGLLPGIYHEQDVKIAQKTLRSYAANYLKEEVQAEALTKNIEGFSRFFEIVSSRSGEHIDFSKFASLAMIERTTARRYFDILVDTLIVLPVEAFAKSGARRLIQHPKYYFFDTGVLNGSLENFQPSTDRVGLLFETLFLQLINSSAKAHDETMKVSSYRTEAGSEVDFIIEKSDQVFAIEVKATKNIGAHDLKGLKSFSDYYGKKCQAMIVYLGDQKRQIDGIPILPLFSALEKIGY